MALVGEKPTSRSRKSKGTEDKKAKKEPSKETPKKVKDKNKETMRSKQASESEDKAPTSR